MSHAEVQKCHSPGARHPDAVCSDVQQAHAGCMHLCQRLRQSPHNHLVSRAAVTCFATRLKVVLNTSIVKQRVLSCVRHMDTMTTQSNRISLHGAPRLVAK